MEKIIQQGILYDFYGELLTDHQKQVYEGLVYENMSLAEIADEQGVSRQAVHDLIKRTDKILEGYENKLGLVERFDKIKSKIGDMNDLLGKVVQDNPEESTHIREIQDICNQIMEII